jgi:hypothetical protein
MWPYSSKPEKRIRIQNTGSADLIFGILNFFGLERLFLLRLVPMVPLLRCVIATSIVIFETRLDVLFRLRSFLFRVFSPVLRRTCNFLPISR